jgi:hypothetical protein
MTATNRASEVTRDAILKLLSDEETARVSTAEGAAGLVEGAEYLDLEHLDQGVQRAKEASAVTMGHVLPRSAVRDETWRKILTQLKR